jgi:hypothetical protein
MEHLNIAFTRLEAEAILLLLSGICAWRFA